MSVRLLTTVALAAVLTATQARAEEPIVLKLATVAPEGTPWAEQMQTYRKRVEKASNGRIKVKAYLGGTLGDENATVSETGRGRIALWGGSTGALGSVVPELQMLELPYLFQTPEEADYILDHVLFDDFKKALEARGYVLGFWAENGYQGMGTKFGCVTTLESFAGHKMRSQESSVHLETFRSLGASPVPIPVTEVLTALQTGVVDGFSNTPLFAFAASWYQGVKSFTVTDHIYQPAAILISKKVFDTLPEELKPIVLGDPRSQAVEGRVGVRALTPFLLQNFTNAKIEVCHLTAEQKATFAKAAKPVHEKFLAGPGKSARPLYEKAMKALTEFRARKK